MEPIGRFYLAVDPTESTRVSFRCPALPQGVIAVARHLPDGAEVARASRAAGPDVLELSIPAKPASSIDMLGGALLSFPFDLDVKGSKASHAYEIALLAPGDDLPALGGPMILAPGLKAYPGPGAWFFDPLASRTAQDPWPPPPQRGEPIGW